MAAQVDALRDRGDILFQSEGGPGKEMSYHAASLS